MRITEPTLVWEESNPDGDHATLTAYPALPTPGGVAPAVSYLSIDGTDSDGNYVAMSVALSENALMDLAGAIVMLLRK